MSNREIIPADDIDIQISDTDTVPEGWSKTHEEYNRPVDDIGGYYLYTYESEHFMVSMEIDGRADNKRMHNVTLLCVKRNDDGERLTALGTGVYKNVVRARDSPEYTQDTDGNIEANEHAEKAAFQVATDIMKDVNDGNYKHKRYSE